MAAPISVSDLPELVLTNLNEALGPTWRGVFRTTCRTARNAENASAANAKERGDTKYSRAMSVRELCATPKMLEWAASSGGMPPSDRGKAMMLAAEEGHMDSLKWGENNFWPLDHVLEGAARRGRVDIMTWARFWRAPRPTYLCYHAAGGGHLEALQWALRRGWRPDPFTTKAAADGGHLQVLKWAVFAGFECSKAAMLGAAQAGRLEIIEWAARNKLVDTETCRRAVRGRQLQVLQTLFAHGCQLDVTVFHEAARVGNLDVIQWLRSNGCDWDIHVCMLAASHGHLAVLQWLRRPDDPCPWRWQTCMKRATECKRSDVVEWLSTTPH